MKWVILLACLALFLFILKPGSPKRKVAKNFLSDDECKKMMALIDEKVASKSYRKRQDNEDGEQQIFDMSEFGDPQVDSIRRRIDEFIKSNFGKDVHIESSYMKVRVPGNKEYAHPIHADNCNYNSTTGECPASESTDSWLSHSILIYLNSCEGGEFFFTDGETIVPEPGLLLAFTSGPENLHGVRRIQSDRYAIAVWFTKDHERREKYIESN